MQMTRSLQLATRLIWAGADSVFRPDYAINCTKLARHFHANTVWHVASGKWKQLLLLLLLLPVASLFL